MQSSGILILALAVASGFALPLHQDGDDRMKVLLTAVTDFLSAQTAKLQPTPLPNVSQDTSQIPIIGNLISSITILTNNSYSGNNDTVIENVNTVPGRLIGQLSLRNPKIDITGKYALEGTVLGFDVAKGEGDYTIEYTNLTTSLSDIRLVETANKTLRVACLGIRLDVDDEKFQVTGLNIQGLSTPAFERIADLVLLKWFNVNKRPAALAWEIGAITQLNKLIGNRTLEDVVEYLNANKDTDYNQPQTMLTTLF